MYEDELTCGGGVGLLPVLPGQPEPQVRATQDVGRGAPHPGGEHSVLRLATIQIIFITYFQMLIVRKLLLVH